MRTLEIRILDSKGFEIDKFEKDFDIRKTNWNIGLTSIDLIGTGNNQIIAITAERFGHSQLIDADCTITLTAGEYESVQKIDMSTREALTPKPKFERPMGIEDGTEIIVRIIVHSHGKLMQIRQIMKSERCSQAVLLIMKDPYLLP